jgi:polyhydroxyalkanoate synthesis regulator phasin
MDSNNLTQLLQKGMRVTLGATASLIEVIQDPEKREQNLARLRSDLGQLAEEWDTKGAMTEQEARNFVDTLLEQRNRQQTQSSYDGTTPASSTATSPNPANPTASPDVQLELQELTAQIAAIRTELEKLRNPSSPE